MSRTLPYFVLALILAVGSAAPRPAHAEEAGPFAHLLFAPELIIKNQTTIGLSADQRRALIAEVTSAQADFLPAQMELAEKAEELGRRLDAPRVDEKAALGAATRLLELESQIKRRHLELAIRIKNLLDEGQQERLAQLREAG
jgi:hypothetical protein